MGQTFFFPLICASDSLSESISEVLLVQLLSLPPLFYTLHLLSSLRTRRLSIPLFAALAPPVMTLSAPTAGNKYASDANEAIDSHSDSLRELSLKVWPFSFLQRGACFLWSALPASSAYLNLIHPAHLFHLLVP